MEMRRNQNIRIGDLLVEMGYVNDQQISEAIAYQRENKGVRMGGALVALNYITEGQMLEALGKRLNYDVVNISNIQFDIAAVEMIPQVLAEKYCMLGYKSEATQYYLIVNDPLNFYGIEDIRQVVGLDLHIVLSEQAALENAIKYYYSERTFAAVDNYGSTTASILNNQTTMNTQYIKSVQFDNVSTSVLNLSLRLFP